jgi:hypothetical protein
VTAGEEESLPGVDYSGFPRAQAWFLKAVASGMRLGPAAVHIGVGPNFARRQERTDPAFAEALAQAKLSGRILREADVPHGESRYINHGCRCPVCTRAASLARTARRHRDDTADVIAMPPPTGPTSGVGPFVLLLEAV